MGCGCLTAGTIALFVLFVSFVLLNKPKEPEFVPLQTSDSFNRAIQEDPLVLLDNQADPTTVKPVKLRIKSEMAMVVVRPGEPNGQIDVDGNFDQANYELIHNVEDKGDHIAYDIELNNKRSFWGMILGDGGVDSNNVENQLVVTLPPNLLLELETDVSMGSFEIDLSGLAIKNVNLNGSMGELEVKMSEPNQIIMEVFKADFSYGEARIQDIQNMRMKKVNSTMGFGEMRFTNSGPIENDLIINAEGSFGAVAFDLPENVKVDASATVFAGEFRKPSRDGGFLPEDAPLVTFKGDMSMGEMAVRKRTRGEDITTLVLKWIRSDGVDQAVTNYKQLLEEAPTKYNFSPAAINNLGYRLLRSSNKASLAIDVFVFNTKAHPYYANGFDSLGEGYLEIGNKELALVNYRRAYEMDPGNTYALSIVEKLETELATEKAIQD
jgi:hypothetical protein